MLINGKNLKIEFDAALLLRKIQPSSLQRDYRWPVGAKTPWISPDKEWGFKDIELLIELKGDHKGIEERKSKLVKELADCTLQFVTGGHFYDAFLIGAEIGDQQYGFETVSAVLLGYEYSDEISLSVTNGQVIALESTANTPVRLEVTSGSANPIVINGLGSEIELSNIPSGSTIIVDAQIPEVTMNGQNAYDHYDSWTFPFLKPGDNTISISPVSAQVSIKYNPRWL